MWMSVQLTGLLQLILIPFVRTNREGDIRLVGASCQIHLQGRLEIYHSGTWGTVCDDYFGSLDAIVVCRQLGSSYSTGAEYYTAKGGSGTIWLDNMSCLGSESKISNCGHNGWGSHDCSHNEDVGVRCFQVTEGDLRLVGDFLTGRLEIFHSGAWGTVCDDSFGSIDAQVACRQMKKSYTNAEVYTAGHGTGMIWMDNVGCNGTETRLDQCLHNGWSLDNCGHSEDVGIRCYGSAPNNNGDLRLVGGNCPQEGRLEIYYGGTWGTVCDDGFSENDARVACRQLGFSTGSASSYTDGLGSGTIWLDDIGCNGNEKRIDSCSHIGWGNHNCGHSEDVGIRCYGEKDVNGNWGQWSGWGSCTVSCNSGTRQRYRQCNNPLPSSGGFDCVGPTTQTGNCSPGSCPVNGGWSSWSTWTSCTVSCGGGTLYRSRQCNNPLPSNGGLFCVGNSTEMNQCNTGCCPVDGIWGEWSSWQQCNATCGGGMQHRHRSCDKPAPLFGGSPCTGLSLETQACSTENCPVDGQWGTWSEWSDCSASCGIGKKSRHRNCNDPAPIYGGSNCGLNHTETNTCNTNICPVDGEWSMWSDWTSCSVSCGGGIKNRTRMCDDPTPTNGGLYCNGSSEDIRNCNNVCCPVNGNWGTWSMWNKCNTTCGEGLKNRTRRCDNPSPLFAGLGCFGYYYEIQNCNASDCSVLSDAKAQRIEPESVCSGGLLGGIAGGCIIATIVIIVLGQFAFRKLRTPKKEQRQEDSMCHVVDANEVQLRSRPNDYEAQETSACRSNTKAHQYPHSGKFEELVSDNTQSGIYDCLQGATNTNNELSAVEDRESTVYSNTAFKTTEDIESTVYTNTAFSNADDRESAVYENLKT